jgi:His/Glu/Gln/Arg/opine family amino acid ABC transporter permease subunit
VFDLQGYGPLLLQGAKLTLAVGLGAMFISMIIGLGASLCKLSGIGILQNIAGVYTTVIRGIPELVLILLVYYGAPTLIQDIMQMFGSDVYVNVNPFVAGTLTIGFIYGAFTTEVFRGAFLSVPKGQIEAAGAYGMNKILAFRRVILPQMWRFAIPGLGNVWMVLIKATALISVIQLPELMRNSDIAARSTGKPFTFYFVASLIYLVITIFSIGFQQWAEKRANRGVKRS